MHQTQAGPGESTMTLEKIHPLPTQQSSVHHLKFSAMEFISWILIPLCVASSKFVELANFISESAAMFFPSRLFAVVFPWHLETMDYIVRYVGMSWTLSPPHTLLAIGWDHKLFHLVSNCGSR